MEKADWLAADLVTGWWFYQRSNDEEEEKKKKIGTVSDLVHPALFLRLSRASLSCIDYMNYQLGYYYEGRLLRYLCDLGDSTLSYY